VKLTRYPEPLSPTTGRVIFFAAMAWLFLLAWAMASGGAA